jgi:ribosomal RNA methyltransferase Nop2
MGKTEKKQKKPPTP